MVQFLMQAPDKTRGEPIHWERTALMTCRIRLGGSPTGWMRFLRHDNHKNSASQKTQSCNHFYRRRAAPATRCGKKRYKPDHPMRRPLKRALCKMRAISARLLNWISVYQVVTTCRLGLHETTCRVPLQAEVKSRLLTT